MINPEISLFRSSWILLKVIPLWLSKFLISTGLIHLISNLWKAPFTKSTLEIVQDLTDNKDLQLVFSYCWGDYGTPPADSHFLIQVSVLMLDTTDSIYFIRLVNIINCPNIFKVLLGIFTESQLKILVNVIILLLFYCYRV
jgi:hypothetical protein